MDFETYLRVAKEFADLDWAVRNQLEKLDSNEYEPEDCNPNALKLIKAFLLTIAENGVLGTDYILKQIDDYVDAE